MNCVEKIDKIKGINQINLEELENLFIEEPTLKTSILDDISLNNYLVTAYPFEFKFKENKTVEVENLHICNRLVRVTNKMNMRLEDFVCKKEFTELKLLHKHVAKHKSKGELK